MPRNVHKCIKLKNTSVRRCTWKFKHQQYIHQSTNQQTWRILTSLNSSSSFRCSIASFSALFLCSFSTFSYFFQYSSIWWEMKINVLLAFTVLLLIIKMFQEKMKCSTYQNLTSVWHLCVQSNWLVSFLHWNLLPRARSSLLVTCTDLHVHVVLQKVKLFQSVFRERQIKNRKVETFSCFLKAILCFKECNLRIQGKFAQKHGWGWWGWGLICIDVHTSLQSLLALGAVCNVTFWDLWASLRISFWQSWASYTWRENQPHYPWVKYIFSFCF